MAESRIESKEVIQPGIFNRAKKEAEDFLSVIKALVLSFKKIGDEAEEFNNSFEVKGLKDYNKLTDILADLDKKGDSLNETLITQVKVQKQVKKLTIEEAVEKEKLRRETKDLRDEAKLLVAEERKELGLLPKLIQANKALRKERDAIQESDEDAINKIAALNAQIDANTDKLKDNVDANTAAKINVGNYTESVKEALSETGLFTTGTGVLGKVFGVVSSTIFKNTKGIEQNTKAMTKAQKRTLRYKKTLRGIGRAAKGLALGGIVASVAAMGSAIRNNEEDAKKYAIFMAKFEASIGVIFERLVRFFKGLIDSIGASIDGFKANIDKIVASFKFGEQAAKDYADAVRRIAEAQVVADKASKDMIESFDGIAESISSQNSMAEDLINLQFEIRDQFRLTELEVAKVVKRQEELLALADDDTRSLRSIISLRKEAAIETQKQFDLREKQASLELKAAETLAIKELNLRGVLKGNLADIQAIINNEERRKQVIEDSINSEFKRKQISEATRDELLAAQVKLIQLEDERTKESINQATQRRKTEMDLFEQNLDLLIDLVDKEKNLSEQFVLDVTKNIKARTDEADRFIKKFGDNARKELEEFNKLAKKLGQDVNFDVQFDEDGRMTLFANGAELAVDNIVELNKQLQGLGLGEIPINRMREFIVEARAATKDFIDLNKEIKIFILAFEESRGEFFVTESEIESLKRFGEELKKINSEEELKASQEAREAINEEFELKRLASRQLAIDRELELVEKGSQAEIDLMNERLSIDKSILEIELENEEKAAQKRIDIRKKEEEEKIKLSKETGERLQDIAEFQQNLFEQRSEKRLEKIDQELDAIKERQEEIRNAIINSNEDASASLAEAERKEAELRAKRERELKRQARAELFNEVLKSYAANLEATGDSTTAVSKTFKDIVTLRAFAASIPLFWEGADRVGDSLTPQLSGRDGHIVRVDDDEMILNPHQSNTIRSLGYNRDSLVQMAKDGGSQAKEIDYSKISSMIKTGLKDITLQTPELDIDLIRGVVKSVIKRDGVIEKQRKSLKGWRS